MTGSAGNRDNKVAAGGEVDLRSAPLVIPAAQPKVKKREPAGPKYLSFPLLANLLTISAAALIAFMFYWMRGALDRSMIGTMLIGWCQLVAALIMGLMAFCANRQPQANEFREKAGFAIVLCVVTMFAQHTKATFAF